MDVSKYIQKDHLKVMVRSSAPKNEIIGFNKEKQALKVNIKAPPENNKANKEVINFFRKLLKKKVAIAKGLKTKEKILKIG